MRFTLLLVCLCLLFTACKKDKYTTVPQIKYKSVSPNFFQNLPTATIPDITFSITDSEGDLGLNAGEDTSFIYLKNLLNGKEDSLPFPDLKSAGKSNFNADVTASINDVLGCVAQPGSPLHIDTLYFEIYVKDFAKNKSNVVATTDPVYFECQ